MTGTTNLSLDQLSRMPQAALDALFRASPSGEIPRGDTAGTVVFAPGTMVAGPVAKVARLLAWQGKVFRPDRGDLVNKVSPFGVHAIRATVATGPSWFDGKECIVIDYSRTSLVAHWIRDEIRLVAPSIYLGIVYVGPAKVLNFALRFPA